MDARKKIELLLTPGIGPADWERLERAYLEAAAAGASVEFDVTRVLCRFHLDLFNQEIDQQCAAMARVDAHLRFRWEPDYPDALRQVHDAPPALFVRGEIPPDSTPMVAIVGTRKPSAGGS